MFNNLLQRIISKRIELGVEPTISNNPYPKMFQVMLKRVNEGAVDINENESIANIYIVNENLPFWGVFEKLSQVRFYSDKLLRFYSYFFIFLK